MVEKKKSKIDIKPRPNTYFGDRFADVEKFCYGKTKDKQIKELKLLLADSKTQTRICLDGWGRTFDTWKMFDRFGLLYSFVAFLLGICWGILLFT